VAHRLHAFDVDRTAPQNVAASSRARRWIRARVIDEACTTFRTQATGFEPSQPHHLNDACGGDRSVVVSV
jgi:hypothetical protein